MTTIQQPPAQTALMPLDPAVSPQQALRILPIRANLLPQEITAGRSARRTRTILIFAVVLTLGVLGGWYMFADKQRDLAGDDLASITKEVDGIRAETKEEKYTKVTATIAEKNDITENLEQAMGNDLPWNRVVGSLRETGVAKVTITQISGTLNEEATNATATAPAGGATKSVATLSITGSAPDKATIAEYLDAAAEVDGVTNVYLASAGAKGAEWTFVVNAEITSERLCGRFTTACKDGAN